MLMCDPVPLSDSALTDVKNALRIDLPDEDTLISSLIATAVTRAEGFCNQLFLQRQATEYLRANADWVALAAMPILSLSSVTVLAADGSTTVLTPAQYQLDIAGDGLGWFRVNDAQVRGRLALVYAAGLAQNWDALPEGLRYGVMRLAAYLYTSRDAVQDAGPPMAVAALLRPYRRMRLK